MNCAHSPKPRRSTFFHLIVALACLCLWVACGHSRVTTPPSERVSKTCDQVCSKGTECDASFDAAKCKSQCTTNGDFRKIDAFRPELTEPLSSCIAQSACTKSKDQGGTLTKCLRDGLKALPASAKAKSTCQKLEHSFSGCDIRWDVPCADELKAFPDEKLGNFDACLNLSCRESGSCFRGTEDKLFRGEL